MHLYIHHMKLSEEEQKEYRLAAYTKYFQVFNLDQTNFAEKSVSYTHLHFFTDLLLYKAYLSFILFHFRERSMLHLMISYKCFHTGYIQDLSLIHICSRSYQSLPYYIPGIYHML